MSKLVGRVARVEGDAQARARAEAGVKLARLLDDWTADELHAFFAPGWRGERQWATRQPVLSEAERAAWAKWKALGLEPLLQKATAWDRTPVEVDATLDALVEACMPLFLARGFSRRTSDD